MQPLGVVEQLVSLHNRNHFVSEIACDERERSQDDEDGHYEEDYSSEERLVCVIPVHGK